MKLKMSSLLLTWTFYIPLQATGEPTLPSSNAKDFVIFYWEAPPYAYNNNGSADGLLLNAYQSLNDQCSAGNITYYEIKGGYEGYVNFMTSNETLLATDRGLVEFHSNRAAVIPTLSKYPDLTKRGMIAGFYLSAPSIAVVMRRDAISIFAKLKSGLWNCKEYIFWSLVSAIIVGTLMWIIEQNFNVEFSRSFIRGGGTGFWWTVVTMTTTGYGDVTPKTVLGRALGIAWMFSGVIMGGIITATFTDALTGTSGLEIGGKTISMLRYSAEKFIVNRDFDVKIRDFLSFELVLDAVLNGDVDAAVLNSDTAAFLLSKETSSNKNKTWFQSLRVVNTIEKEIPVGTWESANISNTYGYMVDQVCLDLYRERLTQWEPAIQRRILKLMPIEDGDSLWSTIRDSTTAKAIISLAGGCIAAGLFFEVIQKFWLDKRKAKHKHDTSRASLSTDAMTILKAIQKQLANMQEDIDTMKNDIYVPPYSSEIKGRRNRARGHSNAFFMERRISRV